VAVVGAGAAGLTAAIFAARAGARVVLLERTADGGRRSSPAAAGAATSSRPWRLRSASFPPPRRRWCAACSWPGRSPSSAASSSRRWASPSGSRRRRGSSSRRATAPATCGTDCSRWRAGRGWRCGSSPRWRGWRARQRPGRSRSRARPALHADRVVVATGGLSVPATGSDGRGLLALAALGHRVEPTYPALTPLVCTPPPHAHLSGLSLDVELRGGGGRPRATGGFLFTHRGYSGPPCSTFPTSSPAPVCGGSDPAAARAVERDRRRRMGGGAGAFGAPGGRGAARHLPARLADLLLAETGPVPRRARSRSCRAGSARRCSPRSPPILSPARGTRGTRRRR
jgi:glycine/D-amino acid oxidase-like deaminating enzyme